MLYSSATLQTKMSSDIGITLHTFAFSLLVPWPSRHLKLSAANALHSDSILLTVIVLAVLSTTAVLVPSCRSRCCGPEKCGGTRRQVYKRLHKCSGLLRRIDRTAPMPNAQALYGRKQWDTVPLRCPKRSLFSTSRYHPSLSSFPTAVR